MLFRSYKINGIDLDGDALQYTVLNTQAGGFDGQLFLGNSAPYVPTVPVGGFIYSGLVSSNDPTHQALIPGETIKVLNYESSTNDSLYWYTAEVTNDLTITLKGPSIISASIGDQVTQSISGATATVTEAVNTLSGEIEFFGNVTAIPGEYVVDPATNSYALISNNVIGGQAISVDYVTVGDIIGFDNDTFGFDASIFDEHADLVPLLSSQSAVSLDGFDVDGVGFDTASFDGAFTYQVDTPQLTYLGPTPDFATSLGAAFIGSQPTYLQLANVVNYTDARLSYTTSSMYRLNVTGGFGNVAIHG